MILSCQNLSKAFGSDDIIKNVSFQINEGDKVAIVGNNGAGKSTLLKMITGELESDAGSITLAKDATLGYLAQYQRRRGDGLSDRLFFASGYFKYAGTFAEDGTTDDGITGGSTGRSSCKISSVT